MIRINVPGTPAPKGRPRFTRNGHTYTDAKTRAYEETVKLYATMAMGGSAPLEGALAMRLVVFLPKPKSTKREAPCVRPDIDNYVKAALDGCNGIVFRDDGQICSLEAFKFYDETPGLIIYVTAWIPNVKVAA